MSGITRQGSALFFSEDLPETGAAKFVLREAIDHFISAYNEQAAPFEWHQSEIKQQPLRVNIAYFCRSLLVPKLMVRRIAAKI